MKKRNLLIILAVLIAATIAVYIWNHQTANVSSYNENAEIQQLSNKKVLVVYFSTTNTNGADIVSSATPKFDGAGSTEYVANYIHSKVGGDIERLTPVNDYPKGYWSTVSAAKKELDDNARPEFLPLSVNPEDYDVIFVGYPMWWFTLPMIEYSFFDTYDFSGKVIIPFDTHDGSVDGGTYSTIQQLEPEAQVLGGIAVTGKEADKADGDIDKWLAGFGY